MIEAFGTDIGGVIIERANDNTDTSLFTANYLNATSVPGAFDALRQLVNKRFGKRVYLVSKCGEQIQKKTLHWLSNHRFYEQTGINTKHVYFCRKRHEKAEICKKLEITHFVDDRLEILGYLQFVKYLYLFQPSAHEVGPFARFLNRVRQVQSWQEILDELL